MEVKKALVIILSIVIIVQLIIILSRDVQGDDEEPVPQYGLAEVSKLWYTNKVNVSDGFVFRYNLWDGYDTAIYYQTGADTFAVVTTFKKITKDKPPVILPDIVSTMDDNTVSSAQVYFPATNAGNNVYITTGWSHMIGQPWNQNPDGTPIHYNKSFSFVDKVVGAYIEFTCEPCYKIEWWAEKRENHGIVEVFVDGVSKGDIDQYSTATTNNSMLLYTTPDMPNATHKIKLLYTGRKHPSASQTNIGHDKFVTHTKQ